MIRIYTMIQTTSFRLAFCLLMSLSLVSVSVGEIGSQELPASPSIRATDLVDDPLEAARKASGSTAETILDIAIPEFAGLTYPHHLQLAYDLYFTGFRIGKVLADLRFGNEIYAFRTYFHTTGVVDFFSSAYGTTLSVGKGTEQASLENDMRILVADKALLARASGVRDGRGWLEFSFDAKDEGRTPPESQVLQEVYRNEAFDPFGAVISILQSVERHGGSCKPTETFEVFEGRTRYRVNLEPVASKEVTANDYSFFSGPAHICRLFLREIASEKISRPRDPKKKETKYFVMFASLDGDLPPIMVQLLVRTELGSGIAYLRGASVNGKEFGLFREELAEFDPKALEIKEEVYSLDRLRDQYQTRLAARSSE